MGMNKNTDIATKSSRIQFWLTPHEKSQVAQIAKNLGYHTVSEYARKELLREHHEDAALKNINTLMTRFLGLTNQLVKRVNEGKADGKVMPDILDLTAKMHAVSLQIPHRYRKSKRGHNRSKRVTDSSPETYKKKRMSPADRFLFNLSEFIKVLDRIEAGEYVYSQGIWADTLLSDLDLEIPSIVSTSKYLAQLAPHHGDIIRLASFGKSIQEDEIGSPEHRASWHDFIVGAIEIMQEIDTLPPQ